MSEGQETELLEAERPGGGCLGRLGRLVAALLVVLMAAAVALLALLGVGWGLGFDPGTPHRLDAAEQRVAALEAAGQAMQTEVVVLRGHREEAATSIRVLEQQVVRLEAQTEQFVKSADGIATAIADVRTMQIQVAAFATAEADRAVLLADIDRRTERVDRFLQRLSDIAANTSSDLQTPTASPTATRSPEPTASPTASPTATRSPEPTASRTARSTATSTPRATRTTTPTP